MLVQSSIAKQDFVSLSETNSLLKTHLTEETRTFNRSVFNPKKLLSQLGNCREWMFKLVLIIMSELHIKRKILREFCNTLQLFLIKILLALHGLKLEELSAPCTLKTLKEPQTVPARSGSRSLTAITVQISGHYQIQHHLIQQKLYQRVYWLNQKRQAHA